MVNEKILQTRISLKIDTLENWQSSTLILRKGEVAFATVAATEGTQLQEPVVMLKVGDGEKTFNQLGWNFYAKAADVLAVCKDETALTGFVNNVIANAGIATDEAMKELAGDVEDVVKALEALTERVTTLEGNVTTLENKVDEEVKGIYEEIEKALKAAKDYADAQDADTIYDDSKLVERIGGVEGRVETLETGLANLVEEHKSDVSALETAIKEVEESLSDYVAVETFEDYEKEQVERNAGQDQRIGELEETVRGIVSVGGEANLVNDVTVDGVSVVEGKVAKISLSPITERLTAVENNIKEVEGAIAEDMTKLGEEIRGEMSDMSESLEGSIAQHAEYAETTYATKTALSEEAQAREAGDNATLEAANDYTDKEVAKEAGIRASEDVRVLGEAKAYADEKDGALRTEISGLYATKAEREQGDADTLEAAKAYTDSEVAKILGDDLAETFNTLKDVQEWVDAHGEKTLDIIADLAQESQERKDADAELQRQITAEAGRAEGVEAGLQAQIDALEKQHGEDVETINGEIGRVEGKVDALAEEHEKDVKELTDLIEERTSGIATEGAMSALTERVGDLEVEHDKDVQSLTTAIAEALAEAKKYADDNDANTIYDDSEVRGMISALAKEHNSDVDSLTDAIEKALQEAKDYADKNDDDTRYDDTAIWAALEKEENNRVNADKDLATAIEEALAEAKKYADEQDADTIYDDSKLVERVEKLEDTHSTDVASLEAAIASALAEAKKYADEQDADTIYDDSKLVERIETIEAEYATKKEVESEVEALEKLIDAKTAGIATEGAMIELGNRVTIVEGEIEKLETTHSADVTSLEKAIEAALEEAKKYADDNDADTIYNDSEVRGMIEAEADRAEKAEGELAQAIADETTRATGIEAGLRTDVDAIKADYLKAADKYNDAEVRGLISAETTRAEAAEAQVLADAQDYADKVAKEVKDTILGTGELVETFDTLVEIGEWIEKAGVDATELTSAIAKETTARTEADTAINTRIDTLEARHTEDMKSVEGQFDDFSAELIDLDKRVDAIEKTYVTTTEFEKAVDTLTDAIEDESKAREAAVGLVIGEVEKLEKSLAPVAKSGLIDDLSIGEGTILIFDCGDSKN